MNCAPQVHVAIPANEYIAIMTTLRELTASLGALNAQADAQTLPALASSAYGLCAMVGRRLQTAPAFHAWIDGGRVVELRPPRPPMP
ncbi:hypothetical protein [Rubrivivax albus]|uniref:Uncharacterized protein n=1 Tax=Rubrivivax albus TaxID=2499835 RepID=A0A3S2WSK0_9BURK|nr:hypothetical protein [Rubrivivax albus]RVT49657.1 hypothetical protein ENE75_18600 [Rubrivivax albus]